MSDFIFSSMVSDNYPFYGKFIHPIKSLITDESNAREKEMTILKQLFNVEKSNRYAETTIGETGFSRWNAKGEGQPSRNDSLGAGFNKTIEHIEYGKAFAITRKMLDDAKFGWSSDMKRIPRAFVRAYYDTQVEIGVQALINGTSSSFEVDGQSIDLTVGDGLTLFNNAHKFKKSDFSSKTQSNYYYGSINTNTGAVKSTLSKLAAKMRNFKDENGHTMDYVPDTILIPSNRPDFEDMVKTAVGSEKLPNTSNNDINTQYGNWNIIVLPGWETTDDRLMVMSSKANRNLGANMFYNRVKCDVTSQVDKGTRNLLFDGYCRFGVGFTAWKHIILAVNSANAIAAATSLA